MIIAAAIKFRINHNEVILCGVRHGDIFKQIELMGFKYDEDAIEIEDGFVTHTGNFLDRVSAYAHALYCGQLPAKIRYEREKDTNYKLISEDLW